jgi:hypothetical protein
MHSTPPPIGKLSKAEAAIFLASILRGEDGKPFTPQVMSKWMRERGLPYFKVGREVRFDPVLLEAWAVRTFARNFRPARN